MNVEDKLRDIGFIIKRNLKFGLNRVGTFEHPNSTNGWIYLKDVFVNYGAFDESIESGYLFTDDKPSIHTVFKFKKEACAEQERVEILQRNDAVQKVKTRFLHLESQSTEHTYLKNKEAIFDAKLKIDNDYLLNIPMYNIKKDIVGIQTVNIEGKKHFEFGSLLKAAFFPLVEPGKFLGDSNLILITEGYSTGSSVFQAMQTKLAACAVIVAFSVGNMDNVFNVLSAEFPNIPILIVKDNDSPGYLPINMGFTVGAFGEDANDLHIRAGLDELAIQLMNKLRFINIGE